MTLSSSVGFAVIGRHEQAILRMTAAERDRQDFEQRIDRQRREVELGDPSAKSSSVQILPSTTLRKMDAEYSNAISVSWAIAKSEMRGKFLGSNAKYGVLVLGTVGGLAVFVPPVGGAAFWLALNAGIIRARRATRATAWVVGLALMNRSTRRELRQRDTRLSALDAEPSNQQARQQLRSAEALARLDLDRETERIADWFGIVAAEGVELADTVTEQMPTLKAHLSAQAERSAVTPTDLPTPTLSL